MANFHRCLLSGENTNGRYLHEKSFDKNMVIVLAALLCVLILALGLNWIVKCAMSWRPRQGEATNSGLKKRTLRQIPVVVIGSEIDFPAGECSICLGEFSGGEKIRVLPKCKHEFHVKCIDKWLISRSSCPICRCSLLGKPINTQGAQAVTS